MKKLMEFPMSTILAFLVGFCNVGFFDYTNWFYLTNILLMIFESFLVYKTILCFYALFLSLSNSGIGFM